MKHMTNIFLYKNNKDDGKNYFSQIGGTMHFERIGIFIINDSHRQQD